MPRAEIPQNAVEALAALLYEEQRTYLQPEWTDPNPSSFYLTGKRRDQWRTRARFLLQALVPNLHAHWLEQLKEQLLSDAVIDVIAEQNAIRELYGHRDDSPTKEARQRRRYAQLAEKPGVQESWKAGARRDVERFLAAISIPIEEGGDGE
jgi:hypothetical protein